ncbi:MAG: hypothetical protein ACYTF1_00220 [Planctomycetota bacterium]
MDQVISRAKNGDSDEKKVCETAAFGGDQSISRAGEQKTGIIERHV